MARRHTFRTFLVHAVRVGVVVALLLLIPEPHSVFRDSAGQTSPPNLALVQKVLPAASAVSPKQNESGFWAVQDANGVAIAHAARTLPEASDVIGYRGPSEAMVLLDDQFNLIGVDLIDSADTQEHVVAVQKDKQFFEQFRSWKWAGPEQGVRIDAVSGATLTSLALAKGVLRRIGGDRPSLVFPDGVTVDELRRYFSTAVQLRSFGDAVTVLDVQGQPLGTVIRTGPLSDNVIGYQGPTELLVFVDKPGPGQTLTDPVDRDGRVAGPAMMVTDVKIRSSFDNEPYVGYCKTEYGFWSDFKGKSIQDLAAMDLKAEGVEGVSGATMTSVAIAETLVGWAAEFQSRSESRRDAPAEDRSLDGRFEEALAGITELRLSGADLGCLIVLCCVPLFRAKGWFRRQGLRKLWLVTVVGVIGLWSGNLVSMALVAGWSVGGIAWRLAPSLAAVALVAFVGPAVGKSNPYCNHLCPHGAMVQLLRPTRRSRRYWNLPPRLLAVLSYLPGTMLVLAYLALLLAPATDLSSWEPFHAYLVQIAPWTATGLAVATLGFSAMVPMGYCRMGCPTGRLLDHLRRSAGSDRLGLADGVAVGLLVIAIVSS